MIYFNSLQVVADKIIIFGTVSPVLYSINPESGVVTYEKNLEDENFEQLNLVGSSALLDDRMFLFPCFGKSIHILNTENLMEINRVLLEKNRGYWFFLGITNNCAYLINFEAEEMAILNCETLEVKKQMLDLELTNLGMPKVVMSDNKFYISLNESNSLLIYDILTGSLSTKKIGDCNQIGAVSFLNDHFIIIPRNEKFILIDDKKIELDEACCGSIVSFDVEGEFYFGNEKTNVLYSIDRNCNINKHVIPFVYHWGEGANSGKYGYVYGENKIFFMGAPYKIIELNKMIKSSDRYMSLMLSQNNVFHEDGELICLRDFIEKI